MRADGSLDAIHSRCVQHGLTTAAECVDHVIPIRDGGSVYDESNLMSACLACNGWKERTIERPARRHA
jgi:5-methylcytosine-specific restriction endonuclease McrA